MNEKEELLERIDVLRSKPDYMRTERHKTEAKLTEYQKNMTGMILVPTEEYEEGAEKDKRIEELDLELFVAKKNDAAAIKSINMAAGKLAKVEKVVKAARDHVCDVPKETAVPCALSAALADYDKEEGEPEEQHFIEEGLT